ncbi:MAG: hypothetical protein RML99_12825 [Anaerolineae bacterium]|nr:hypothetical protein [Anaerolineae bacterium]
MGEVGALRGGLRIGSAGEAVLLFDASGQPIGDCVAVGACLREEIAAREAAEAHPDQA